MGAAEADSVHVSQLQLGGVRDEAVLPEGQGALRSFLPVARFVPPISARMFFACVWVRGVVPFCLEHDNLCLSPLKQQKKGRRRWGIATLAGKPPQQKPGRQSSQALGTAPWRGVKHQLEKRTQTAVGMNRQRRMARAPVKARPKRTGGQLLRKPECHGHSTSKVGCGAIRGAAQALYYEQAAWP